MRRLVVLIAVLASSAGCEEKEPEVLASGAHALITEAGDHIVVLFTKPEDASKSADALAESATEFWWLKFEVPVADAGELTTEDGLGVDLASSAVPLGLVQSYRAVCDPSADLPDPRPRCWLRERYIAGEVGLEGTVVLLREGSRVSVSYSLRWEGVTDRFEGPEQLHIRTTGGRVVGVLGD